MMRTMDVMVNTCDEATDKYVTAIETAIDAEAPQLKDDAQRAREDLDADLVYIIHANLVSTKISHNRSFLIQKFAILMAVKELAFRMFFCCQTQHYSWLDSAVDYSNLHFSVGDINFGRFGHPNPGQIQGNLFRHQLYRKTPPEPKLRRRTPG